MNKFLDFIIPRFVTDDVAVVIYDDDTWEEICLVEDLTEDICFDAIPCISSFNLLGYAFFPRVKEIYRFD